jgi:hypothetical protein
MRPSIIHCFLLFSVFFWGHNTSMLVFGPTNKTGGVGARVIGGTEWHSYGTDDIETKLENVECFS